MRFGIWTPLPHTIQAEPEMEQALADLSRHGQGNRHDRSFEFAANILCEAEDSGFETTLIAERWLGPDLECWIMAAALAQRTHHMELMVAAHPGIMTPQVVAKMGASLDRISGGRLAVNIVNGWWAEEMNLFGNGAWMDDADVRAERMGEFIEVLSKMWTQDSVSYAGKYYRIENGSLPIKPLRRPSPRIYAASRAPSGKELVARICDVWFAEYKPDYRLYEQSLEGVRRDVADMRQRASRYGRTLEYGLSAHVICADTMEEALSQAHALEAYGEKNRIALIAAKAIGAGLLGTPELIAERITQYTECGIGCFMLRFHPMQEGLRTFASKVMPLLGQKVGTSIAAQAPVGADQRLLVANARE